jgi:hypothetical protein
MGMLAIPLAVRRPEHRAVILALSTPCGQHIECLTVPAPVVAGAIIRFANGHGIAAANVEAAVLAVD